MLVTLVLTLVMGLVPGATNPAMWALGAGVEELPQSVGALESAIVVRVEQPTGAAARGADVRLFVQAADRAYLAAKGRTDVEGAVEFDNLPELAAWVVADAKGFARGSRAVVLKAGESETVVRLGKEHVLDVLVKTESGKPVEGAEVVVVGSARFPVGVRTNADGRARVEGLSEGPYSVDVRSPGWSEEHRDGVRGDAPVEFALRKLSSVAVSVVDARHSPVSGATVEIAGSGLWPKRTATTNGDGKVHIAGLRDGVYAVRALKGSSISPTRVDVAVSGGESTPVELVLAAGTKLQVTVVGRDTKVPIAGARVSVAAGGLAPFPDEAVTDARGIAQLGPLPREEAHVVRADADDYVAALGTWISAPLPDKAVVELDRAAVIEGRIVDERGLPVDGATLGVVGTDSEGNPVDAFEATVSFQRAHFFDALSGGAPLTPAGELGVVPGPVLDVPHALSMATGPPPAVAPPTSEPDRSSWVTRLDGTFHLRRLAPGTLSVVARHPQFVETWSDYVDVAPGETKRVKIVMRRGAFLDGRVVDERHHGIAGIRIELREAGSNGERVTWTATDGSFAFAAVGEDLVLDVIPSVGSPWAPTRQPLSVEAGRSEHVEIVLERARPPVQIVVRDDRGYPLGDVSIEASVIGEPNRLARRAMTNPRGEAQIGGLRGARAMLDVRKSGFAPHVSEAVLGEGLLEIVLSPGERVEGRVLGDDDRALSQAEITVFGAAGARRTMTDDRGHFELRDLDPGTVRIRARANGHVDRTIDAIVMTHKGRRSTDVDRITLESASSIEGEVTSDRGERVAGARVAVGSVPSYLPQHLASARVVTTDESGKFTLPKVSAGANITIMARAPDGREGKSVPVSVQRGRDVRGVRITLGPKPAQRAVRAPFGLAITLGETTDDEVIVVDVVDASAADRAGLRAGDKIVSIDGRGVRTIEEARSLIHSARPARAVLRIARDGRPLQLEIEREPVRH